MKNVTVQLAAQNWTLMEFAPAKFAFAERSSCDRRKQPRRPKTPKALSRSEDNGRLVEAGIPSIDCSFSESFWFQDPAKRGAFY